MLIATTEVRWFFRGSPPPELIHWFRRGDLSVTQPARVDAYLLFPGCSTAAVKVRQGKLEVKARAARHGNVAYPGDVGGAVESWVKWSRPLLATEGSHEVPGAGPASGSGEEWVNVGKQRMLRGFSLQGIGSTDTPVEVDAAGDRPASGACLEFTALEVPDGVTSWWTLAFEGFGAAQHTETCLTRVATHFFAENPPPLPLRAEDSESYAAWLARGRWRS